MKKKFVQITVSLTASHPLSVYIQGFLTKSSQQLPGAGQFPPEACLQLKGAGITTKAVAKSRILGWGRRLNVSVEMSKAQEIPAQASLCLRFELH